MATRETRLVGLHRVKRVLADGSMNVHYYAWRGGPAMMSKPGSHAFVQEYVRLTQSRQKQASNDTVGWMCAEYLKSAEFQKLRDTTRRDYERSIRMIRSEFETFPVAAIEAKGSRKVFLDWRDTMRSSPRAADLHISVLGRIFALAKDREVILRNPLERVSKLHDGGNRKDTIWMPAQINRFLTEASPHLVQVVKIALWTMQRQGDVLTMPTIAYDDGRLWITQGKTGARIRVRPAAEIVPILEGAREEKRQRVLVNSAGDNWTASGFRASFRTQMAKLGIDGVRFHDLRGTGISFAYANGMDIDQIAEISGHAKKECEAIIRRHYLAGADVIEAIRAGTKV